MGGVIGLELQERKDRGVKASKRQSWLSKRWNAFIRAWLVASNVATSSLPFLSALQCPSAEKISFSRLSRFAALAAISLRSPTSVSLSFFLSSPLASAALVLSTLSSSTAKTTVSPLKRRSIWRPPKKEKRKKGNSSSFFHVSRSFSSYSSAANFNLWWDSPKLRQDLAASEVTCKREVFVDLVVKFARLHYMIWFENFPHGFNFAWRLESFASAIWARLGKFRFIEFNVFFRKFTGSFLRPS